jgi:hypothetical protein
MPKPKKANEEPEVEGHMPLRREIDEDVPTPENADPQVRSEGDKDEPEVEGHVKLKKT